MGNLHSVRKAFLRLDHSVIDVRRGEDLVDVDALVLPGVGAFDPAMDHLEATGLIPHLRDWVDQSKPLLGICLGLQLLFEGSSEGARAGLGFLEGVVERLPDESGERIPHMGWSPLTVVNDCPLLAHSDPETWVYFVHSYAAVPTHPHTVAATTRFGQSSVTAMVWRDNIGACQFHPEKSSDSGAKMLERWLAWLQNQPRSTST